MSRGTAGNAVTYDTDVLIPQDTEDKLWLLSYYEAYKITGSEEEDSGARSWDANFWLRSPTSPSSSNTDIVYYVDASGSLGSNRPACNTHCARPAFKISIT